MTILAWLFLAVIISEAMLVVIDLVVWRVYSKEVTSLKLEVIKLKAMDINACDRLDDMHEDIEDLEAGSRYCINILNRHGKKITELFEKGENKCQN